MTVVSGHVAMMDGELTGARAGGALPKALKKRTYKGTTSCAAFAAQLVVGRRQSEPSGKLSVGAAPAAISILFSWFQSLQSFSTLCIMAFMYPRA